MCVIFVQPIVKCTPVAGLKHNTRLHAGFQMLSAGEKINLIVLGCDRGYQWLIVFFFIWRNDQQHFTVIPEGRGYVLQQLFSFRCAFFGVIGVILLRDPHLYAAQPVILPLRGFDSCSSRGGNEFPECYDSLLWTPGRIVATLYLCVSISSPACSLQTHKPHAIQERNCQSNERSMSKLKTPKPYKISWQHLIWTISYLAQIIKCGASSSWFYTTYHSSLLSHLDLKTGDTELGCPF